MGDSRRVSSAGSGRNPFDNDIHQKKIKYGGTVVGAAADFQGVQKGNEILEESKYEGHMLGSRSGKGEA